MQKLSVDTRNMTEKQIHEVSVPNPYNFPINVGDRKLIVIDGPNCVGKTTLARELSLLTSFNIQVHSFGIMEKSPDVLLGEILAVSRYGDKLIQDRSIISWMLYNGVDYEVFDSWCENIQGGKVAVVCMMATLDLMEEFSSRKEEVFNKDEAKREIAYFTQMFRDIPLAQKIDCYSNDDKPSHWRVYDRLVRMWGKQELPKLDGTKLQETDWHKCPKCGELMVITAKTPMGVGYKCPVCPDSRETHAWEY